MLGRHEPRRVRRAIDFGLWAAVATTICVIWTATVFAESATIDEKKEILRLQYTEFCATVPKNHALKLMDLGQYIASTLQQRPDMAPVLQPWLEALGSILERYQANGCGET